VQSANGAIPAGRRPIAMRFGSTPSAAAFSATHFVAAKQSSAAAG
jgi:hypothetical protein